MDTIRILVVEDDIFISQDIVEMLEQMDYTISGVAYDGDAALAQLHENTPDFVLLDINLGEGKDGIDVAEVIRTQYQLPFIFLTSYASKSVLDRAKQARPSGYVVKPFDERDLYPAIEIALYNHAQRWQPDSWHQTHINRVLKTDFTQKEVEILQDMFEGKTNRQLSEKHFISLNTVKTHVLRIYDKLDVHSRSEAMAALRKRLR
ncbi:MAG: response regulator transcription factor [Saprospiraceae bacterium]|nr:response regulator transcription factor [Saprospiraceae bacterium]